MDRKSKYSCESLKITKLVLLLVIQLLLPGYFRLEIGNFHILKLSYENEVFLSESILSKEPYNR